MQRGWTVERLGGHECEVFEPRQRNRHGYVVLYLHGVHLGRLAEQTPFTDEFERQGLPVIGPRAGPSWWVDRLCAEFDERITSERHVLENVLPAIQERWSAAPPRIGLLGTSMGGQGALRLSYKYPDRFPVVAAISPAIDFHTRIDEGDDVLLRMYGDRERARQDTALLHIHPLNWPRHQFFCCDPDDERWWEGVERLQMKLQSLGIPHECDLDSQAGGHGFGYYNRMAERAVGFLVERLDRERLRLV